jgi:uncharacterized membrane protein
MNDSDLLFSVLTAAALGVVIILAPGAARAAADEASGLCIGAGAGQSDVQIGNGVTGENDIQIWAVGLSYKF